MGNQVVNSQIFFASELFHRVQMAAIFADSKTFADAKPNQSIEDVLAIYAQRKPSDDELAQFVAQHFSLPSAAQEPDVPAGLSVPDYLAALWPLLIRRDPPSSTDSLLPLPKSYVVPGGRFREIYYWDSYFTAVGLMHDGHESLVQDMLDNFVELQHQVGHVPNGSRAYYHSRSQPPIMALLYRLLEDCEALAMTEQQVKYYYEALQLEYAFWMDGEEHHHSEYRRVVRMPDGEVLNRYWDDEAEPRPESYREDTELAAHMKPTDAKDFYRNIRAACESGWDFSSRWMADPSNLDTIQTTRVVPVDLNVLLYLLEQTLADMAQTLGDCPRVWQQRASQRADAIQKYCWNIGADTFVDYNLDTQIQSPVRSLATVLPLFAGIATASQAQAVSAVIASEFLVSGGLITTLTTSEQQWDAPNGWAPLHWFAVQGLERYGHSQLAEEITARWLKTVSEYFTRHGTFMEKYNVVAPEVAAEGGEYEVQHGFGWTNGVTQAFLKR